MKPLIPPGIFDNILLLEYSDKDKGSRVIYQDSRKEFFATRLDSLTHNFKETWSTRYDEVTWGNTRYKLYVQPVQIAVLSDAPEMATEAEKEWMLIGLVESSKFASQSRTISHFRISLFLFLVFLVLVSLPLFKLHFIGEREELKRADILLTAFSLFIGAGVLTLFLLSVYSDKRDSVVLDKSLKPFAREIENNLNAEIDSLIKQIKDFTIEIPDSMTDFLIPSILADSIYQKDIDSVPYPYFRQLFWIDENGMEMRKLGIIKNLTPLVSVRSRPYFQSIKNKQSWYRDKEQAFYIQPIISITTGVNSAVVSIPDTVQAAMFKKMEKSLPNVKLADSLESVAAITVHFISLLNTTIPSGFGFCIIDNEGQVLFHHEQNKNLRENFFTECDDNPRSRAVVFSRVEKNLDVNYLGRGHRLYVRPIENLPWTLVTFADLTLIRSSELNALAVAIFLFTALAIIYLVLLFLSQVLKHSINLGWLWPQKELQNTYQLFIISLFCAAGFYYAEIFNISATTNLYFAFFLPPIIIGITYLLFKYRIELSMLNDLSKLKKFVTLFLLLLFCSLAFWLVRKPLLYGLIGLLFGLILSSRQIIELITSKKFPVHYTHFAMSGVAFLLITSILPVIAFFKVSYDNEMEVFVKRGQLSLLTGIEERKFRIIEELGKLILDKDYKYYEKHKNNEENQNNENFTTEYKNAKARNDSLTNRLISKRLNYEDARDIYCNDFYNTFISDSTNFDILLINNFKAFLDSNKSNFNECFISKRTSKVDSLLAFFRSKLKIVSHHNWELYNEITADSLWEWKRLGGFLCLEKKISGDKNKTYIISLLNYFKKPDSIIWFMGIPLIIILLIIVLIYFVQKVFTLDVLLPSHPQAMELKPMTIFQNTIYIGQPNSGKSEFVKRVQDSFLIDFRKYYDPDELLNEFQDDKKIDSHKVFVLDHFDLNIGDDKWNRAKLRLIEKLISVHKKIVMIVTTIDPIEFLSTKPEKKKTSREKLVDKHYFDRCTIALSSFAKVYHNIKIDDSKFTKFIETNCSKKVRSTSDEKEREKITSLSDTIIAECRHTSFLQNVGKEVIINFDFDKAFFNKAILIDEILQRAESCYQSIWSVCSIEEKITLIHLAKNGFVTPKDAEVVNLLIRKGLIKKAYGLSLFRVY